MHDVVDWVGVSEKREEGNKNGSKYVSKHGEEHGKQSVLDFGSVLHE